MESKHVYLGIATAREALARRGLGKNQTNTHQGFKFRGIDDLYEVLQPALQEGDIVLLPDVLDVKRSEHITEKGKLQWYTVVTVDYHVVSLKDGSEAVFTYAGESADTGDKSLSKALTMALKTFAFAAFQIPLNGNDDADKHIADATEPPPIPEETKTALELAASEGTPALREAWKGLEKETREFLTKFHLEWWNSLKAKADGVKP